MSCTSYSRDPQNTAYCQNNGIQSKRRLNKYQYSVTLRTCLTHGAHCAIGSPGALHIYTVYLLHNEASFLWVPCIQISKKNTWFCQLDCSTWSRVPSLNFTLNRGTTATEVYQELKNLYGDDWLVYKSSDSMYFQEGRESLEDDDFPGQPVSARSNKNVEKACYYVLLLNCLLCFTSLCVCG
jgi:hypothetical protein